MRLFNTQSETAGYSESSASACRIRSSIRVRHSIALLVAATFSQTSSPIVKNFARAASSMPDTANRTSSVSSSSPFAFRASSSRKSASAVSFRRCASARVSAPSALRWESCAVRVLALNQAAATAGSICPPEVGIPARVHFVTIAAETPRHAAKFAFVTFIPKPPFEKLNFPAHAIRPCVRLNLYGGPQIGVPRHSPVPTRAAFRANTRSAQRHRPDSGPPYRSMSPAMISADSRFAASYRLPRLWVYAADLRSTLTGRAAKSSRSCCCIAALFMNLYGVVSARGLL